MGLVKFKSFCITKEIVSKLKRLPTEWDKIFASCTADKGLDNQSTQGAQKTKLPKPQSPVKKW
jgi:hypothetical protein